MFRLISGECTAVFEGVPASDASTGSSNRGFDGDERHGHLTCLVKPDDTVLVHDRHGYRPVAWLTRADAVTVAGDPPTVSATDGDRTLTVHVHTPTLDRTLPASDAGKPTGACPDCDGTLVATGDAVACIDCDARYGLPTGAALVDGTCDCGLPRMTVTRGAAFDLCVDRGCESLDEAVRAAFDRAWDCPECEADLRIVRAGGLFAGCDRHPDCETAFRVPRGVVGDPCGCGLPTFEHDGAARCLDARCSAAP